MLKTGDLVIDTLIDRNRIGTVLEHHPVGVLNYYRVLWIATGDYPVSMKDFYEDYAQEDAIGKYVFVINDVKNIPKHLLPPN